MSFNCKGIVAALFVLLVSACGVPTSPEEERGLAQWGEEVRNQSAILTHATAHLQEKASVAKTSPLEMQRLWLQVADVYHPLEGMVGGISVFRAPLYAIGTGLDATGPDASSSSVARYSGILSDGRPLPAGGNLLHAVLEPMLWNTGMWAKMPRDSAWLAGAAVALHNQAKILHMNARTWKPTRHDALFAVSEGVAYTGFRLYQWSEAQKGDKAAEINETFPAQSRLIGMSLSLKEVEKIYRTTFWYALMPDERKALDQGFSALRGLMAETISAEKHQPFPSEEERTHFIDTGAAISDHIRSTLDVIAERLGEQALAL